ncbi:hypothetical protein DFJ74DRAFT_729167 [Hyaloraphidium curvatum]|nr:hypothetical protein DFJ74DRAFT_729167 [Hyaloraphidium curvatum]
MDCSMPRAVIPGRHCFLAWPVVSMSRLLGRQHQTMQRNACSEIRVPVRITHEPSPRRRGESRSRNKQQSRRWAEVFAGHAAIATMPDSATTTEAEAASAGAFALALAPVRRLLPPEAFSAARARPHGPESSPFHRIYTSAPVLAVARWLGALALGAPEAGALEVAFDEEIRRGLSRPSTGHTEDALALQLAVVLALVYVETTMARPAASRNLLAVLVDLWRRDRVPGEAGVPLPQLQTVDNLLIWLLWLDVFWVGVSFLLVFAWHTKTEPIVDPAIEFSTVPVGSAHCGLPRPALHRQGGPIPQNTVDLILPYTCADVFRWMEDFDHPGGLEMLRRMIGGLPDAGFLHLELLLQVAGLEQGRQAKWCAEQAGMSTTEVLAAECAGGIPGPARGLARHAVKRMVRLREAMAALEAVVPRSIAFAFLAGDLEKLCAMLNDHAELHEALSFLTIMQVLKMLGVAPEPFVDLAEEVVTALYSETPLPDNASSVTSRDSDVDTATSRSNTLKLSVWFSSANYTTAASAADAVCTGIRSFLRSSTPEQIKSSVYATTFCIAATHAAWIRLLELRHLCRSGPQSSADFGRCTALLGDVSVCTAVLRASGIPRCAGIADMVAGFLDGQRTAISRTDLLGLRMARVVTRVCPHGDAAEGGCWACATEVPDNSPQVFPGRVFFDDALAAGIGRREPDSCQGRSEGPNV